MPSNPSPNPEHDPTRYRGYISRALRTHRVFVDIEVFMKRVLHVPDNWRQLWGDTIRGIKLDTAFSAAQWEYTHPAPRTTPHKPLVDMGNTILRISRTSSDNLASSQTRQGPPRKGQSGVPGGTKNAVTPHTNDSHPQVGSEERDKRRLGGSNLPWAKPLLTLRIEPLDDALVDGSRMPRLMANGVDPQKNHAPYTPPGERVAIDARIRATNEVVSALGPSRKRTTDHSSEPKRKSRKIHHQSTPGGDGEGPEPSKPQTSETDLQKYAYLQVGQDLLEQFLISPLCPHATVGLVSGNRIQFYHANRSVILVSSAIDFSGLDQADGLDMFIAIIIAFDRLSLKDSGILHGFNGVELSNGSQQVLTGVTVPRGGVLVREGNKLEFGGDEETGPFTLTLGKVISREPSLVGRSTVVFEAESSRWKGLRLAVKTGWPGSSGVAENKFLEEATKKARMAEKDKWALKHLPRILYSQDVVFDVNSMHGEVASLFDNSEFASGEFEYDRRTLRVIVQEQLCPFKTLTDAKDVAQVLLDIICIHRWLYDNGILHRDLSMSNIMYRFTREKVYGVLMDYDLASWRASLKSEHTKGPVGTPPFMAHGLLTGSDPVHLYRHDLESIFYVMLIATTHYEVQAFSWEEDGGLLPREGNQPFWAWFEEQPDYPVLGALKSRFFSGEGVIEISSSFTGFYYWFEKLCYPFCYGFRAKRVYGRRTQERLRNLQEQNQLGGPSDDDELPPFDDETLGGYLTYSKVIETALQLKGELNGLVVRYPPPTSPT